MLRAASRLAGAGLLSLGLLASLMSPASAAIPTPAKAPGKAAVGATEPPRRMISGWLPYWSTATSLRHVEDAADLYTDASPFWYDLRNDGTLARKSGVTTNAVIADTVSRLHAQGIPVYPTVGQQQDTPKMVAFLGNGATRARHVADLVAEVRTRGFDGIDLDYESMTFGGTLAQRLLVHDRFVILAQELATELHKDGKKLSITVGPRLSDSPTSNWAVYDYAKLGAAADRFRVMTYDYGWKGGKAQAVAPYWWVEKVVQYTVARVPAAKVWVGVPTYGYDWPATGKATGVTHAKALELQRQHGVARVWNEQVGASDARPVRAPSFRYMDSSGVKHTVFYNDAASISAIVSLVGTYQLGGAALWSIGSEDPATWDALRGYGRSVAPQPTVAALTPTEAWVAYGASGRLRVKVKETSGTPVAGVHVTLQQRRGNAAWTTAGQVGTDGNGSAQFTVTPRNGIQYRVVTARSWTHAPAVSPLRAFRIARTLQASVAAIAVRGVPTIRWRGLVTPGGKGIPVTAQRRVGTTWQTVAKAKTDSRGRFTITAKAKTLGTQNYRVVVSGTRDYAQGVSTTAKVTVRR